MDHIKLWLSGLFLALLSAPANGNVQEIPEIGNRFASLSPEDERLIGRAWLYSESSRMPILLNAPLLQDYFNQLCQEIAGYTGIRNLDLKIVVLIDPTINAFAAPGGVLGINLGLLTSVESEDELASVIAHEFAHLSQHHTLEIIASAKQRSALTYGSFLAGLGMLITGNPAIGFAALFSGIANESNMTLDAVRLNEEEADSIAFATMTRAGRDAKAGLSLIERLYKQNRDGALPEVFRSHPLSSQRITSLQNRILSTAKPSHTRTPQQQDQINFHAAQILAGMHLAEDARLYIKQVKSSHHRQPGVENIAYKLGLGTAYNHLGGHKRALELLQPVYQSRPFHQYVGAEYARALAATGDMQQAGQILNQLLMLNPNHYLLNLVQVEYLHRRGDTVEAIALLERLTQRYGEDLWIWNTLFEYYGKHQQIDKSHFANGHINYLLGNDDIAVDQFRLARKKTKDSRLKTTARDMIVTISQRRKKLKNLL